jgi:hypothetical protein
MNRYDPGTPRKALALAAAAIATLAFGLMVVLPAQIGNDGQLSSTVTAMHDLSRWVARAAHPADKTHSQGKPATRPPETAAKRPV